MEIRRLKPCEYDRTRPLYEEVFPEDDAAFVDYYYTWKTRDNVIFVAEDEDGVHAMVHLNPFCVRYFGRDVQLHYIVAVATQPQYRHRGLMRSLLALAEQEMRAAGEPFTFLMPVSEAIYRPFGYRFFAWQRRGILRGADDGGERLADAVGGRFADSDGERPVGDDRGCLAKDGDEHREDAVGGCPVNDGDMHVAAGAGADQRMSDCTNIAGITCRPLQPHEYDAAADFANALLDKEYDMFVLRDGAYYERLCAEQGCQGGEMMAIHRSTGQKSQIIGLFRTAPYGDEGRLSLYEVILCQEHFAEAERALRAFAAPYGRVAVEGCQERLALEQAEVIPLMMGKTLCQAEDAEWQREKMLSEAADAERQSGKALGEMADAERQPGKALGEMADTEKLPGKVSELLIRKMPEQMDNPKRRSIFLNEVV